MFSFTQKYDAYQMINGMFSGFEFMGFFLGIAFLTMLASCLMFKILSGSKSDVVRYEMLGKIGARQALLKQSIRREIGILFLAPGVLGAIHVLFGLQMFTVLMDDPYSQLMDTIYNILCSLLYLLCCNYLVVYRHCFEQKNKNEFRLKKSEKMVCKEPPSRFFCCLR